MTVDMLGLRRIVWRLAGVYAVLGLLAALYALYQGNVVVKNSEFSGLPLLLLSLPWSVMYEPGVVEKSFNRSVAIMSAFVAANALAMVVLGFVLGLLAKAGPFSERTK